MSMCRVFSCVVGRGCFLWPVHSLGRTLLAFALLHSVLQGQICLLLQVFLDYLLLHSSPLEWKGHLFWLTGATLRRYPTSKSKGEALVGGAKSHLELNPIPTKMLRGLKQTLWTWGPRDPTETETELCLSVSWGGMGQQWPAAGAGALDTADLGMA